MKNITRGAIFCLVIGALFISGCTSLFLSLPSSSSSSDPAKSETASITGRLEKDKNHFVLTDVKSGLSYRFVGLQKPDEAQLSPYVGSIVTVKLVVKSTESAKARIAQFIAIVK